MEPWEGVLKIPEGKRGEYAIKHVKKPAGTVLGTSSMRTALMGGHAGKEIVFEKESKWHELSYEGGVWMTDLPIEQAQHDNLLVDFGGSVLVGGLGLGYTLEVLANDPGVDDIEVVEVSQEVADLVWPHVSDAVREKTSLHVRDLFDFLKGATAYPCAFWDCAFYDIWQSDGLGTFFNVVLPIRELSDGRVDHVVCWNEDVMRGQLFTSLQSRMMATMMDEEHAGKKITLELLAGPPPFEVPMGDRQYQDWDWARPFWSTCIEKGIRNPGKGFDGLAGIYCRTLGIWSWDDARELHGI